MGCDIHICLESKQDGKWVGITGSISQGDAPFDWRDYGLFGFLAGVRNLAEIPIIVAPRDFPVDASYEAKILLDDWAFDFHTPSWITVKELLDFDYDQAFWDRWDANTAARNGETARTEEGERITIRKFLGQD